MNDTVFTLRKITQLVPQTCSGCGARPHQGGHSQCPGYNVTCYYCQKVGHYASVCHSKQTNHQPIYSPSSPSAQSSCLCVHTNIEQHPSQLSTIKQVSATDPAPTISIQLSSFNGSCHTEVLCCQIQALTF